MRCNVLIVLAVVGVVSAAIIKRDSNGDDHDTTIILSRRDASSLQSDVCSNYFGPNYPYMCSSAMQCLYCPGDVGDGECQVCNGRNECPGGEDEEGCETSDVPMLNAICPSNFPYSCATTGSSNMALCLSEGQICDGIYQCEDDSDEHSCDYSTPYGDAGGQCPVPNQFKVGTGGLAVFLAQMLEAHNYFRCLHGSSAMAASDSAIDDATIAAANSAAAGQLTHTFTGENLALLTNDISQTTGYGITKMWYDEVKDYNYANPSSSTGVTGHFTQVVWAASKNLGCDYATDRNNRLHIACEYEPHGNMYGQYLNNVHTPI